MTAIDLGGESELPYLPLVAALRPLARSGDPALTEPVREAVAPLLPGLGVDAPELRGPPAGRPGAAVRGPAVVARRPGAGAPGAPGDRGPALGRRLDTRGADVPGTQRDGERVLVVGSYRPDEVDRRHPLRPLLAELARDPRARRIELEPLTRDELAEQLADILGAPPAPDLLERLWTRSGGNPLFGEELLAGGRDGRGAAPDTLRDALMLRAERLSGPAQELLRLVAVGERLDHPLLEEVSGLGPRALRDALREAVEGHILVAPDDDVYRFRHALLREVVEGDLLPGERSALHLTLARALERRVAEDSDAQLTAAVAHHFAAAGDQPAALAAAVRAATAAERVHAHGEAAALLDRALELWDRVPDAEALAGMDRVTALGRAADAAGAIGDPGRRLALLERALRGLGTRPDPHRAARILESTARAQRHLNRSEASIATLERALGLLENSGDDADPSSRAGLLSGLARALMIVGRYEGAAAGARQALRIAAAADLTRVEGQARNTLGFSLAMTGDVDEGAAELREAIRIAHEHDSPPDLAEAYDNYADMLHIVGRSAAARDVIAEGAGWSRGGARAG